MRGSQRLTPACPAASPPSQGHTQAAGLGTVPPGHGPSIYPQDSLATALGEWGLAPSVWWSEPCAHLPHQAGRVPEKPYAGCTPHWYPDKWYSGGLAHIPHDAETQNNELPATWEMSCAEPQAWLAATSRASAVGQVTGVRPRALLASGGRPPGPRGPARASTLGPGPRAHAVRSTCRCPPHRPAGELGIDSLVTSPHCHRSVQRLLQRP